MTIHFMKPAHYYLQSWIKEKEEIMAILAKEKKEDREIIFSDDIRSCKYCGKEEEFREWPRNPKYEASDIGRIREKWDHWGYGLWAGGYKMIENDFVYEVGVKMYKRADAETLRFYFKDETGRKRPISVSTVVLETFVGKSPSKKNLVKRKDGSPENNCLCNIGWL